MEVLTAMKKSASAENAEEAVKKKTNKMTQWLFRNSKENLELDVLYPGGLKNCFFGSWVDASSSFQNGALFMGCTQSGHKPYHCKPVICC